MAVATLGAVVVDCPDPAALAGFYAGLLGGKVVQDGEGWAELIEATNTLLAFQAAPGFVPPQWPRPDGSQQFHLDLTVPDLDAAEREGSCAGCDRAGRGGPEAEFPGVRGSCGASVLSVRVLGTGSVAVTGGAR